MLDSITDTIKKLRVFVRVSQNIRLLQVLPKAIVPKYTFIETAKLS